MIVTWQSAILQCSIYKTDDLLSPVHKCILIVTGDQHGVQHRCKNIGNGMSGAARIGTFIMICANPLADDFFEFVLDSLAVAITRFELRLDCRQHHFEDVGIFLNVLP